MTTLVGVITTTSEHHSNTIVWLRIHYPTIHHPDYDAILFSDEETDDFGNQFSRTASRGNGTQRPDLLWVFWQFWHRGLPLKQSTQPDHL